MVDAGIDTVVMEVSAATRSRRSACTGSPSGRRRFTNLTRDHLDYHKDMEDVLPGQAEALRARTCAPGGVAVVNGDDTYAARIYNELRGAEADGVEVLPPGNGEISAAGRRATRLAGHQGDAEDAGRRHRRSSRR